MKCNRLHQQDVPLSPVPPEHEFRQKLTSTSRLRQMPDIDPPPKPFTTPAWEAQKASQQQFIPSNRSAEEAETARYLTAYHEAGHAVMRWMLRLPPTAVHAEDGYGYAEGTGVFIPFQENTLIALAGYAAELNYCLPPDVEARLATSKSPDIVEARDYLSQCLETRVRPRLPEDADNPDEIMPVEEAVVVWFMRCCGILRQQSSAVDAIADALLDEGSLPAERVAEILSEFDRDE
jgi:hypothetical protein